MTFHRRFSTLVGVALLGLAQLGLAAGARAQTVPPATPTPTPTHDLAPNINDPAIVDTTPQSRGNNFIWLDPNPDRRVGRLLVFLPTGGPTNIPSEFRMLGREAASLGYHAIFLAYRNEAPVAAAPPAGCGPFEEAKDAPEECAIKIRTEILKGVDRSTLVSVNPANSIENRLDRVLEHLVAVYDDENWSQFLGGDGKLDWSRTVLVGSSLGAGQAVLIAEEHEVYRVGLLHGWTDARHGWVHPGATTSDKFFSLIHARDAFFRRTCFAYEELGLTTACPLADFPNPTVQFDPNTALVEHRAGPPFNTRQLVFNLEPNSFLLGDPWHSSTSRDGWIAREADGTPSKKLLNAWRAVLGDKDGDTCLDEVDRAPDVPDAADTDADRILDACDKTPHGTTPPTITVPAHMTVDATGPGGALVPYTVTAADDIDDPVSAVCSPAPGSLFGIGVTTVRCDATDAGGNRASATFMVTVLGAKEQLGNLIHEVVDSSRLPAAIKTQLIASLQSLLAGFDPNKPLQRAAVCLKLKAFSLVVQLIVPRPQKTEWTADATRIRAVLGCN